MVIREKIKALVEGGRKRIEDWRSNRGSRLFGSSSRGQSLVIMAVAFLGMIAFVGFVVDTGIIYLHRVWLGQAVDSASLAAGYELPNIKGSCARAVEYLQANGYENGTDFSFQIVYPDRPDVPIPPGEYVLDSVSDSLNSPGDCSSISVGGIHNDIHLEVQVSATQQVPVIFMHLLGFGTINVTAPSTTERSDRYDIVLILDVSGSMKFDTCSLIRPGYGCNNRYENCTAFFTEDFQDDNNLNQVQTDGWTLIGMDNMLFSNIGGAKAVNMRCAGEPPLEDPDPYTYDFSCVNATVNDNIQGYANVLLNNCTVTGNVIVIDGHLDIYSSSIGGNVKATDTWLMLDGSTVNNSVDVNINTATDIGFIVNNNNISGNVKIWAGGYVSITDNTINGNLDVNCPTIVLEEDNNDVDGNTTLCSTSPPSPDCAAMYRTISSEGYDENVALFFTVEESDLDSNDDLEIYWRPDSGVGWSKIAEYHEAYIPDGVEQLFGVVLPSAAWDNPDLQIRFEVGNDTDKWLRLDNIQLATCSEAFGPWVWYKSHNTEGCRTSRPLTCYDDDLGLLAPGVSVSGNDPPMANLVEQPMTDTLLAASTFIDLIDSRRPPAAPRGDQIGLVSYNATADKLLDLTTDYEAIKTELFTNFRADGGTNLGGGMRVGLSILGDGRWNSTHYMILLTDGWPNHFDEPYINPTDFGERCRTSWPSGPYTNNPCDKTLEFIDAMIQEALEQNVVIFTIGLGSDLDTQTFEVSGVSGWVDGDYSGMDILERIASGTNGQAYHAPTTEELEVIFAWIAEAIFIRIVR
jgi:hypothetical protein